MYQGEKYRGDPGGVRVSHSLADAAELLARLEKCGESFIHKRRYIVPYEGHNWEVDVFAGLNEGLRVAEIELSSEAESFQKPDWVGEEVSGDPRYYNANLINNPYCRWKR